MFFVYAAALNETDAHHDTAMFGEGKLANFEDLLDTKLFLKLGNNVMEEGRACPVQLLYQVVGGLHFIVFLFPRTVDNDVGEILTDMPLEFV